MGLHEVYEGDDEVSGEILSTEVNGKKYFVEELDDKRPFRCFLDVGLRSTTTGARVFGALKGAADGGLDIPHSEKRFPGYDREEKKYDADFHKERIFGQHVSNYMKELKEEDEEAYNRQFADYIKEGVGPDDLEEIYKKVHSAIREDPSRRDVEPRDTSNKQFKKAAKLTYDQRKAKVEEKRAQLKAKAEQEMEEDD